MYYCHDAAHSHYLDTVGRDTAGDAPAPATHPPVADLALLKGGGT